jgi:hypothetical protein
MIGGYNHISPLLKGSGLFLEINWMHENNFIQGRVFIAAFENGRDYVARNNGDHNDC